MWLLADLFHDLPEVGDVDKPKLVFFFDEAHLLFHDASEAFLDQIAQTVRLIRSKGVGVFFVTQSPTDVPDEVLAQLGSRIQHQLRAHTPERREGAQGDREHLPHVGVRRPRRGDHRPRHRRGDRDRDERARCADAGRVDPAAGAGVADGADGPGRDGGRGRGQPAPAKYAEAVDRDSARERLAARLEQGAAKQAEEAGRAEAPGRGGAQRPEDRKAPARPRSTAARSPAPRTRATSSTTS